MTPGGLFGADTRFLVRFCGVYLGVNAVRLEASLVLDGVGWLPFLHQFDNVVARLCFVVVSSRRPSAALGFRGALLHALGRTLRLLLGLALRRLLPPPVSLAPEDGELILICAQRPHAVAGFDAGLRVSMQAFVNADGAGKRLTLDS